MHQTALTLIPIPGSAPPPGYASDPVTALNSKCQFCRKSTYWAYSRTRRSPFPTQSRRKSEAIFVYRCLL